MRAACGLIGVLAACNFQGNGRVEDGGADGARSIDAPAPDAPAGHPGGTVEIKFNNAASAVDLVDFPVMVHLSATQIDYAAVTDPPAQLQFKTADGSDNDLPFEVESWSATAGAIIWVKVPLITAQSTADRILMVYGSTAMGMYRPQLVWTAGYDGVWHFNETLADSVNGHNGNGSTTGDGTGRLAGGRTFNPISTTTFASSTTFLENTSTFSLELWIRPGYASPLLLGITQPSVLTKTGGVAMDLGRVYASIDVPPRLMFQVDFHFTAGGDATLPLETPGNQWTHVVYSSFDAGPGLAFTAYQNGVPVTSRVGGKLKADNSAFRLGSQPNTFVGALDELRVAHVGRSADWILAQHLAMTDAFITYRNL